MGFKIDQKIVLVTRETRLQGLKAKWATKSQAKFALGTAMHREMLREAEELGESIDVAAIGELARERFEEYEEEQELYDDALQRLRQELGDFGPKVQVVERGFLPNFLFGPNDVVVTVGQDGLVANTAKYALRLPIVAVNPDPKRIDGVLLPFTVDAARHAVRRCLEGKAKSRSVTLAEAVLPAGQRMLGFNDLFIGARSHVSARYRIKLENRSEPHSSSGVIVSTGAGSTGWLSSIFNMAAGLAQSIGAKPNAAPAPPAVTPVRLPWEDPRLTFVVREPFVSKHSGAGIVAGMIEPRQELIIESLMPANGVIFSDGIEDDYLEFNSGAIARIRAAAERAQLVVP
jgi:NAD kinase